MDEGNEAVHEGTERAAAPSPLRPDREEIFAKAVCLTGVSDHLGHPRAHHPGLSPRLWVDRVRLCQGAAGLRRGCGFVRHEVGLA